MLGLQSLMMVKYDTLPVQSASSPPVPHTPLILAHRRVFALCRRVCLNRKHAQIYPFSIAKVMFKKMILRSEDPGRPKFYWCENGTPEEVSMGAIAVSTYRCNGGSANGR